MPEAAHGATDRFGNALDPIVSYARGLILRGTDEEVARMLLDLEVDIAVDLKGHTTGSRPGILAHRPAPILPSGKSSCSTSPMSTAR